MIDRQTDRHENRTVATEPASRAACAGQVKSGGLQHVVILQVAHQVLQLHVYGR